MTKTSKFLSLIAIILLNVSCGKDKDTNFTLNGSIKGLKKGIVYLQKNGDSTDIIDLDSMIITGQSDFSLKTNIEEPLLLYLKLHKNDNEEHYIPFFADKGEMTLHTTLKNFNFDAEISGSKQQALLDEYLEIMGKYNDKNLDIIEASLLAQKEHDSIAVDSLTKVSETLLKRKYSFTIQFALNHKDSEIAPYLALYEIPSANPRYIDSVYNGLDANIKKSFYGIKLREYIENRPIR